MGPTWCIRLLLQLVVSTHTEPISMRMRGPLMTRTCSVWFGESEARCAAGHRRAEPSRAYDRFAIRADERKRARRVFSEEPQSKRLMKASGDSTNFARTVPVGQQSENPVHDFRRRVEEHGYVPLKRAQSSFAGTEVEREGSADSDCSN